VSRLLKHLSGLGIGVAALLWGCGGADPVLPGGNGGGVGSGGTGILATGVTIGPISGFGSIVVADVVYDIDSATLAIEDTDGLKLGATVRIEATPNDDGTAGTATHVQSAVELRGDVDAVNTGDGSFVLMGSTVTTSGSTVFEGLLDLKTLVKGHTVQVHGLPYGPGLMRATRVEKVAPKAAPVVSGFVQGLNTASRTFQIGALSIDYSAVIPPAELANGVTLRVRGTSPPVNGVLKATVAQGWYKRPTADGVAFNVSGVVADFESPEHFHVLGTHINAANAKYKGGTAADLRNGVKIAAKGVTSGDILIANNVDFKQKAGGAETISFTLSGPIVNFLSDASFTVKGQLVDASDPTTVFAKGTRASLSKSANVKITGTRFGNGALLAERVEFK
jgi:hypothetical protein